MLYIVGAYFHTSVLSGALNEENVSFFSSVP